jgi:hypothetical protein
MYYLCIFLGERVTIPTGSEIDGTYLDSNGEEIKKHFKKFKEEWPRHGITLQGCALRIVSQCCSSSECEKNWSTFALIHTKVHNRLSYKKLHKLVYVNYNLCIRLRQADTYKREKDPFDKLMELSLNDAQNLIRD